TVESLLTWGGVLAQIAALAAYARWGARWARQSAAGPVGTGMLLGMLGFALVWAARLPLSVVDLWWQRHHGLSHVGYATFVFGDWFALGGQFVFLCLALAIVMGLARKLRHRWWIAAAPVFVGLALLFAFVDPYLLGTHRLADPQLQRVAAQLERQEHVGHVPVVAERRGDGHRAKPARRALRHPSRRSLHGRRAEDRDGARARTPRAQSHLERRRLVRAIRVPGDVPPRSRRAVARRHGSSRGDPARAARARRTAVARTADRECDKPPHGGRGRLAGA